MDVHAVLKALYQERELLNQAIVTLEILARGKGKRRGVRRGGCARGDRDVPHGPGVVIRHPSFVIRDS